MNNIDTNTLLLVLAVIFLVLAGYFNFRPKKKTNQPSGTDNSTTPLRLQAYERLILLMERLNPQELVMRYVSHAGTVADLQLLLLSAVRSETEHNFSQQLYVSNEAWTQVTAARNAVNTLINQAAAALSPEVPAITLSRKIIELSAMLNPLPTTAAIKILKAEARSMFK